MVEIQLDGRPLVVEQSGARTLGDLIEIVKTNIDPDTIITSLTLEGASLADADWFTPLNQQRGKHLEVATGTRKAFMLDRLAMAKELLDAVSTKFQDVERLYATGLNLAGSSSLSTALKDLQSFMQWYFGVLELNPKVRELTILEMNDNILDLKNTCDQLFQHQLYNAWSGISNTIKNQLVPQLAKFGTSCTRTSALIENNPQ